MRPFNAPPSKPVPGFGTWTSPVSTAMVAEGTIAFSELQVDGEAVYWLEGRAHEGGRRALVRWVPGSEPADALGATADLATRVHEYGGGAYVADGGLVVFADRSDGSVGLRYADGAVRTIVAVPGCRYAGFTLDRQRGRVLAVREDHRDRPPTDPHNAIVAFALEPSDPAENAGQVLHGAHDFVLAPHLSADGKHLAFIAWNHPLMPWDGSTLYVASLDAEGGAHDLRAIAGSDAESIAAADWSPDGALLFASDRTNWWNLYAWREGTTTALGPIDAETAFPPWVFGRRAFVALGDTHAMCVAVGQGEIRGAAVANGKLTLLPIGTVDASPLPYGMGSVFIAAPPDAPAAICRQPLLSDAAVEIVRAAGASPDPGDVSCGTCNAVPTSDGETTYVTFYPPRNAQVDPPAGALPPLIVMSHGGPTSMHASSYDVQIAFWTTRGFAVAHVNYRGSSGFGRAYRQRLQRRWGVLDVIDCVSAARWAAATGRCDPARIAIRGGSASGMTALLAVATSDVFGAAVSRYGVMDLNAIAADTHKFESRYTDGLVGPLPETKALYDERSPLTHAGAIRTPVLILQGLDDRVVPPDQATRMRDALAARGVRVVYEAFAGEGHGFRRGETIRRAFDLELDFYRDVFALS